MTTARSQESRGAQGSLGERQAELVAALVAGAAVPPGFDVGLVESARLALLRKRAGDVARHWPRLAASFGARWPEVFAEWAAGRPPQGGWQDGMDLARSLPLTGAAAAELAARTPRPRRWWRRR